MFTVLIILLFVLKINDTVSFKEGEIIASNPKQEFKAPFEAKLLKIYVTEGQKVSKGDTLLTMKNEEISGILVKLNAEATYLEKKIASLNNLKAIIQEKKNNITAEKYLTEQKFELDRKRILSGITALDKQYQLQGQRLLTANDRYITDSILYNKDMLSKMEMYNTKDANNNIKENVTLTQSQLEKQLIEKNVIANNYLKEQNQYNSKQIEMAESGAMLIQSKNDLEKQLIQTKESIHQINAEIGKQFFIAGSSGIVNQVFNSKQTSNIINKGDLLVSIAPQNEEYYARLYIPEKDLQYIKPGLVTHLKLDAYYHLQYGILEGSVTFISALKENEKYFALAKLPEVNRFPLKSGYSVKGEIIIERMPLYKYIIKKIFKKIDS
jgi:multidrug efflux pump subunit AcrA (membrane-fusion protein)